MWLNALQTRQEEVEFKPDFDWKDRYNIVSKNPNELAIELCLASVDDVTIRKYYKENGMPTCDDKNLFGSYTPEYYMEMTVTDSTNDLGNYPDPPYDMEDYTNQAYDLVNYTDLSFDMRNYTDAEITKKAKKKKKNGKRKRKWKKKHKKKNNKKERKIKNNAKLKKVKKDEDRISGASGFLSDTYPNSDHHPWLCSLRSQGFRGRHRCGVTLLSGPTEQSPSDPFVLVGAAHCNYICKDKQTGYPLETCCCRPQSVDGSCRQNNPDNQGSPFCPENPDDAEFKLADPEDLVIVCGEFDTDVELIWWSIDPEEVFKIEEIINHPDYKPHEVQIRIWVETELL